MPDLCLTLAAPSLPSLEAKLASYAGRAALIEARLDFLEDPRVPRLPQGTSTRFLATCRPLREGGRFSGSERERLLLLSRAGTSGFSWIDLEHDVNENPQVADNVRIVRSYHNFDGFPASLDEVRERLEPRGDLFKIAVRVATTRELVTLLKWMGGLPARSRRLILGMGEMGGPSRLLGALLGNRWTYVCENEGDPIAPGQFSLQTARDLYRLPDWTTPPEIYGVMGNPVSHSRSPLLHNALFRHYGLRALYLPLPVDDLASWFGYLGETTLDLRGFSVTLPHKTEFSPFLDGSEDFECGSINTLIKSNGWRGCNTDYQGFLRPLRGVLDLQGARVLVLGNGGVARTVVRALLDQGSNVTTVGRDQARVTRFAARLGCRAALFGDLPLSADLCINTTPVGQFPDVDESPLRPGQMDFKCVYDLIYNPRQTRLLKSARELGMDTIEGLAMFLEQAALQFKLWTGIDPDRLLMQRILDEA